MRARTSIIALSCALILAACNGPAADKSTTSKPSSDKASQGTTNNDLPADASAGQDDIGTVLAVVGASKVGDQEFRSVAHRRRPAEGNVLSMEEKNEILSELVDQKILFQEALNKGMHNDPKVQKLMIQTLMRKQVYGNVRNSDFTPEELKEYFEANREEFVVPEKVQIKRILIRVREGRSDEEAKAIADKIHAEAVADPTKFKELAEGNSEDAYRRRGGDLGYVAEVGKPGVPPEVVEQAFELDVNAISDVFRTDDGYNVVMNANRRERVERSFEQMKGSVLRKVKNERYKELYDEYVSSVRGNYKVETFEKELENITVEPPKRMELGAPPRIGGPEGIRLEPGNKGDK